MITPIEVAIQAAAGEGKRTLNIDAFQSVSTSARKLALSLGIELRIAPPYQPLAKSTVEHARARMMGRRS
jgi:hypothetical protein